VCGEHRATINRLQWMWRQYPFVPGDRCCQKTVLSFVDSVWEIFGPLLRGVATTLISDSAVKDPRLLVTTLAKGEVTRIVLVPSLLQALLDEHPDLGERLPLLSHWTCSGEALTDELAERFLSQMPGRVLLNLYGSTEVAADAACFEVAPNRRQGPVPIGRPIDNMKIYILDRQRQPTPIGVAGELYIAGEGLARGYLGQAELARERFVANPFDNEGYAVLYKTGDLARYRQDGLIEYLGRLDHQVKIRGFRIELGEVESVLVAHPAVREAVVLAREDVPGDKRLVAYLLIKETEAPKELELRAQLRQKLPEYMIPSAFVVLDRYPLTPNGKVDRKALPRLDPRTSRAEFTPPGTETQKVLANFWSEILGIPCTGVHDNFFDLGGHSLLVVRMVHRINSFFDARLAVAEVFQNPTVAQLAKIIEDRNSGAQRSSLFFDLKQGGVKAKTPLYFIHAGPGESRLAKLMRDDRPVCGIQIPFPVRWLDACRSNRADSMPTLKELASLFVEVLREQLGVGPCILAGHSFAGLIAFEVARQFQMQGGKVDAVVIIDKAARLESVYRISLTNLRQCWSRTPADPGRLTREGLAGRINRSALILRWLLERGKGRMERALGSLPAELSNTLDVEGVPVRWEVLTRLYRQMQRSYRPEPLDCRGIVIRAAFIDSCRGVRAADAQMGWSGLFTRGLATLEVIGDHISIIRENAESLAAAITEAIEVH
jgi:thioesterase domain-containing protein